MTERRRYLAAGALLVMTLLGSSPALPHASVVRTSPKANSTVEAPPDVAIFFSEKVVAAPDAILVKDENGTRVDQGNARGELNGRVVRTSLNPLATGVYRVNWKIRSSDGHVAEGSFTFQVR